MYLKDALDNYLYQLEHKVGSELFRKRKLDCLFFEHHYEWHIQLIDEKLLVALLVAPLKAESKLRGGYSSECKGPRLLITETLTYCADILKVIDINPTLNLKERINDEIKRLGLKRRTSSPFRRQRRSRYGTR